MIFFLIPGMGFLAFWLYRQAGCRYDAKLKKIVRIPDEKPKEGNLTPLIIGLICLASAYFQAGFGAGVYFLMSASFLAYGVADGYKELFYLFAKYEEIIGVIISKEKDFRGGKDKVVPLYRYVLDGEPHTLKGEYPREKNGYTVGDKVVLRYNAKRRKVYEPRQHAGELVICVVFCAVGVIVGIAWFFG